jgi:SET domain-containing protein
MSYKPLPDCLTIRESEIEGLGLFATEDIPAETELGLTHIVITNNLKEVFKIDRTPLGGFYNHSDDPNCSKYPVYGCNDILYYLVTTRNILAGEEITVKYTFYDVGATNPEENN